MPSSGAVVKLSYFGLDKNHNIMTLFSLNVT